MKKNLYNGLKPIPESKMSREARIASQAHKRATRKKRAELRRLGLPMIVWKDGKVREVPRRSLSFCSCRNAVEHPAA